MAQFNDRNFVDRRSTADTAKKALLEKFRAQTGGLDPAAAERKAAREAVAAARLAREAEREAAREAARLEKLAQEAAERAAREEAERIAAEEREAARKAEEEAREKARPRQILRDFFAYAEARAANSRR